MREVERVYAEMMELVQINGLPERTAMALLQAAVGSRVRNASYRISADISKNLASRDLKTLVDTDLLVPEGEKRGRSYIASRTVAEIRHRLRLPRNIDDPFAEGVLAQAPDRQANLFP